MDDVFGPVVIGALIALLGVSNMKGNISSVHWYHRKRVTEENRAAFGKMIGLGTIICGISLVIFGYMNFAAVKTQMDLFVIAGSVVVAVGVAAGLGLSLYAMFKYNKGIF